MSFHGCIGGCIQVQGFTVAAFTLQVRSSRGGDRAPVRLRISHQGKRRFVSAGLEVVPSKWNDQKERVRMSHLESARVNSRLAEIEEAAQQALVELQTSGRSVTAGRLKDRIEEVLFGGDSSDLFCSYAKERIQAQYDHEPTRKAKLTSVRKFKRFLKAEEGGDLPIGQVTERVIQEFRRWLLEEEGNATSTAGKDLSAVRRVCKIAIKDGRMSRDDDPFRDISVDESTVSQKRPLSEPDLQRLQDFQKSLPSYSSKDGTPKARRLRMTSDLWLWSFYMMGARFGDVLSLEWNELQEAQGGLRWRYTMQKTDADKDIRVVGPAKEILSDYSGRESETRFVFPALDRYVQSPEYDTATDDGIRRAQKAYGSRVWKDLQIIRERAEIEVPLSMHVARHTFAVQAIEAGWTIRDLQRAFAHSTLTTTEQYIRSLRDDELDDQHEDLF